MYLQLQLQTHIFLFVFGDCGSQQRIITALSLRTKTEDSVIQVVMTTETPFKKKKKKTFQPYSAIRKY